MENAELYGLYMLLNAFTQMIVFGATLIAALRTWRFEFILISVTAGVGLALIRFPPPDAHARLIALVSIAIYLWFFCRIVKLLNRAD